jgi:hypothetical protein
MHIGPGFFLGCMQPKSTKKIFLATKGIKIQEFFWMKKPNINHRLKKNWMKKPKLDENKIKIGDFFNFTSIMWMNVDIFCFIVVFYVASLASPQI